MVTLKESQMHWECLKYIVFDPQETTWFNKTWIKTANKTYND